MKGIATLAMAALALSVLAAPQAGAERSTATDAGDPARQKMIKGGLKVVATDPEGDWGENTALGSDGAALGHAIGQDLVAGLIEMAEEVDEPTVNFILKVTSLPPFGGWPEITRYVWGLTVDGEYVELDGKYLNYSRGLCDYTSGQCPPPRDPGEQPFFVRGNCTQVENVMTCEEIGVVQGVFAPHRAPLHDYGPATITIPVPLEMLGAKRGAKISAGMSEFSSTAGGPIIAMPTAFFTTAAMPLDTMQMSGTFRVPKK